jgi:hypothetical protein
VSNDEAECVPGRGAETLGVKSDLDIGVFGDELHVLIQAPQDASNNTLEDFVNGILLVSNLLILVNNVLENKSNEGDKCYQE